MIKERRFSVHPNVLSVLLHLRLKDELGVKASRSHVDREEKVVERTKYREGKGKRKGKAKFEPKTPHLSKKAIKVQKERKEIEEEMREAEVDVDREERAKIVSLTSPATGTRRFEECLFNVHLFLSAHGNTQTALRPLLPDTQGTPPDTTLTSSATRNIAVRASRQYRFLQ